MCRAMRSPTVDGSTFRARSVDIASRLRSSWSRRLADPGFDRLVREPDTERADDPERAEDTAQRTRGEGVCRPGSDEDVVGGRAALSIAIAIVCANRCHRSEPVVLALAGPKSCGRYAGSDRDGR